MNHEKTANKETLTCECGGQMSGMMKVCMRRAKWMPLFPLIIGLVLFLVGYLLNAETVRVLWLVFSSLIVLMGGIGLVMARRMAANFSGD